MTTVVSTVDPSAVPRAASDVLSGTPAVGDPAEIHAVIAYLRGSEERVRQYWLSMHGASRELHAVSSEAVTSLHNTISDSLLPGSDRLACAVSSAKAAFEEYCSELERIRTDANRIEQQIDGALNLIRERATRIAEIAAMLHITDDYHWRTGPPLSMPDARVEFFAEIATPLIRREQLRAMCEFEWWTAAIGWSHGISECDGAEQRWQSLCEERISSEKRLTSALGATAIGHLIVLATRSHAPLHATIATSVTGVLPGSTVGGAVGADALATSHPLLRKLTGSAEGDEAWHHPPDPDGVALAWNQLTEHEQDRLVSEVPWVIGNLPGLPFSVRDRANHLLVAHYLRQRDTLSAANQKALDDIMEVLSSDSGKPPVQLVALDLGGEVPKAAVGYGHLDTADHLAWQVPGMNNDVHEGLGGWDRASKNLYFKQEDLMTGLGVPGEDTGLITYFEYDTPNVVTVLSADTARDAAPRLAAELDGTVATRESNTRLPNLSVIAHSYGTPVAANALTITRHDVQSFTMVASAGLDAERVPHLNELHVDRDVTGHRQVYTTIASRDLLAPFGSNVSGRSQPNPQSAWSAELTVEGAHSFSSNGLGDLLSTNGHSILRGDERGYFDDQTQSLHNIAALTLGAPEAVVGELTTVTPRRPNLYEQGASAPSIGWSR